MSRQKNADIGAAGERHAAERLPELELVDDHDEHKVDGHLTADVVATIGAVETVIATAGTPIEVKTVSVRKADGSYSRRGEVHIRRENHDALLEDDGEYVVVLYEGDRDAIDDIEFERVVMLSSRTVDAHISAWTRDRRYGHDIARIPWSRLLDVEHVEGDQDAADDESVGATEATDDVAA